MATSEITLTKSQELAWRRYYDLTKPKVVALILFTALVGMLLSTPGMVPVQPLVLSLIHI